MQQRGDAFADVLDRMADGERRGDGEREEELRDHAADHRPRELVFKFAVERTRRVVGDETHRLGRVKRKRRECTHERGTVCAVDDHGVLRAVKNRNLAHAVHIAQVIFQDVRLMQRHAAASKMYAHAPGRFMHDFAFHSVSVPPNVKESRERGSPSIHSASAFFLDASSMTSASSSAARRSLMSLASA